MLQCCMVNGAPSLQQCDCSSRKVVWSGITLSLSPGRVSVSRGREFLLSLASGWAGLGRPDLAPAHFPPSASEGELESDQLGLERRQHRVPEIGAGEPR